MTTTPCESLDLALKTLWGASRWPGLTDSAFLFESPGWTKTVHQLDQLASVHASGVLYGPHGVGKSTLLHHWSRRLSPKQYRILRLAHSSLVGSDLLRQLVRLAGKPGCYRRGDNVLALAELWREWAPAWPLVLVEEAQDLSIAALEELRLLTGSRSDATSAFSLILCGDEDLLGRLDLGVNRALVSRFGFCLHLDLWPPELLREYFHRRLEAVGIATSPFEPAAETLLLQSAFGCPRNLNALLQRAMEQAALASRRNVGSADVQVALDTIPWIARIPVPSPA
jgi:general secretion pathway protein A